MPCIYIFHSSNFKSFPLFSSFQLWPLPTTSLRHPSHHFMKEAKLSDTIPPPDLRAHLPLYSPNPSFSSYLLRELQLWLDLLSPVLSGHLLSSWCAPSTVLSSSFTWNMLKSLSCLTAHFHLSATSLPPFKPNLSKEEIAPSPVIFPPWQPSSHHSFQNKQPSPFDNEIKGFLSVMILWT